jgi:hypothetical protein
MTTKAFKNRIHASKERLDAAIRDDARRFGHHGPENLIETVRQRQHVQLDPSYAVQLCRDLAGWKG